MNPHIRYVVIENLSNFVNYTGRQLWRDLRRSNPASYAFNFTLINQTHSFDSLRILLPKCDQSFTLREVASFLNFKCHGSSAHLSHHISERPIKTINTLIQVVIRISCHFKP